MLAPVNLWANDTEVKTAPEFSLPQLSDPNKFISLEDFAGKFVYLDFWAAWCGPCRKSLPWMAEIHSELDEIGVNIVAVNLDRNIKDAHNFLARYPVPYTVLSNPEGNLAKEFAILGMPSSFLISPAGKIVWQHTGFKSKDKPHILQQIRTLVGSHQNDKNANH